MHWKLEAKLISSQLIIVAVISCVQFGLSSLFLTNASYTAFFISGW